MTEKTFLSQDDKGKGKGEEKKSLLKEEEPLRIKPREVKSVSEDILPVIEPKRPPGVSPKETLEKKTEKTVAPPVLTQAKIGTSPKTEGKSSPFFRFLFILSFAFMALALGLLLLPLLNISIPPFLNSVINLIAPK